VWTKLRALTGVSARESPGISFPLPFTSFIAISPHTQKPVTLMKGVESSCKIFPTKGFSPKVDKGNLMGGREKTTVKGILNAELLQ